MGEAYAVIDGVVWHAKLFPFRGVEAFQNASTIDGFAKVPRFGDRNYRRSTVAERTRDLALFNLAVESKLRVCDRVKLRVPDVARGERETSRAIVMQQKTHRPDRFESTEQIREAAGSRIR